MATSRRSRGMAAALVLSLAAAACGGGGGGGGDSSGGASGGEDEGTPQRGGKVIYALESETNSGWCLHEAQLAISGIQVARAVYDTLVQPDESGDMKPMLAESVEPNDTFDEWTIKLREGVKFHDGTDLNAEVVKNNLDAYRGEYEGRSPLLFVFVLDNIDTVEATDDMTVTVTTKTPWPAFASFLWNDGRLGIAGQAQLDDAKGCDENLVGTGPFMKTEWKMNDHFSAEKNPDYWQDGEDGEPLPYLDEIEFRPQPEMTQRIEGVQTGTYDMADIQGGEAIEQVTALAEQGTVGLVDNTDFAEVNYILFNESEPPFDNEDARRAVAHAIDMDTTVQLLQDDPSDLASGPFAPGTMGYLEDSGQVEFNLEEAKKYAAAYEKETGEKISFAVPYASSGDAQSTTELYQSQLAEAGIEMKLQATDQANEIDRAIAGDFGALTWRNHPGGDPDLQYVWWHSGSPVNFGRLDDPEIDRLLEEGRVSADPEERTKLYEDLNRQFAKEAHNFWTIWVRWGVMTAPTVHGVMGPPVDGNEPFPGLATGQPVSGLWVEQ